MSKLVVEERMRILLSVLVDHANMNRVLPLLYASRSHLAACELRSIYWLIWLVETRSLICFLMGSTFLEFSDWYVWLFVVQGQWSVYLMELCSRGMQYVWAYTNGFTPSGHNICWRIDPRSVIIDLNFVYPLDFIFHECYMYGSLPLYEIHIIWVHISFSNTIWFTVPILWIVLGFKTILSLGSIQSMTATCIESHNVIESWVSDTWETFDTYAHLHVHEVSWGVQYIWDSI